MLKNTKIKKVNSIKGISIILFCIIVLTFLASVKTKAEIKIGGIINTFKSYDEIGLSGDGTEVNPFKISNRVDFEMFIEAVRSGYTFEGKYIEQTADIIFDGTIIKSLTSNNVFGGIYNGKGHILKNIYLANSDGSALSKSSMFGKISSTGVVKNLGIVDGQIIAKSTSAIVCNYLDGKIENCYIYGTKIENTTSEWARFVAFSDEIGEGSLCNCYFAGRMIDANDLFAIAYFTDATHASTTSTLRNTFWITPDTSAGYRNNSSTYPNTMRNNLKKTDEEFKNNNVLDNLNIYVLDYGTDLCYWVKDDETGYPILSTTPESVVNLEGSGTSNDPYLLTNFRELKWFIESFRVGRTYEGQYIKQTADIECTDEILGLLGASDSAGMTANLSGVYDGNGYSMKNLSVNGKNCGLFGCITDTGVVKNLGLKNANIISEGSVGGGIAAICNGTIENCFVTGSIASITSESSKLGGIFGKSASNGVINNVFFIGTISGGDRQYGIGRTIENSNMQISNSYWINTISKGYDSNSGVFSNCSSKTELEFKSDAMVRYLNGIVDSNSTWIYWEKDEETEYPIFTQDRPEYSSIPLLSDDSGMIVSASIINRVTGTPDFDTEEAAGSDTSASDNIVRSFDKVSWEIEANMAINSGSNGSADAEIYNKFRGGTICIEATLPEHCKNLMHWDIDSMLWANGTAHTTNDGLTLNAQYKMVETNITVPGKQSFDLFLQIDGAGNGTTINPTIKLWLNGNESDETKEDYEGIKTTDNPENEVVTTSKTGYNILTRYQDKMNKVVSIDLGDGQGLQSGRMIGVISILQLYSGDQQKGLKGIEYPTGPISFDYNLKLEEKKIIDGSYVTTDVTENITPVLWNYRIYTDDNEPVIADREMIFGNIKTFFNKDVSPYGSIKSSRKNSIYNSGNVYEEQVGNLINVTVSDYGFDGVFPTKNGWSSSSLPNYNNYEGCFSSIYTQIFVPFNNMNENSEYNLTVKNENLNLTSISGITVNTEMNETDNQIYRKIDAKLNKSKELRIVSEVSEIGDIDMYAPKQSHNVRLVLYQSVSDDEGTEIKSANILYKFDGDILDVIPYSDETLFKYETEDMTWKYWFLTKTDGTNWANQTERNTLKESDLVLYENLENIPEGHVCVGIYFESQGGMLSIPEEHSSQYIAIKMKIKENAPIGETYGYMVQGSIWCETLDRTTQTTLNPDAEYPTPDWKGDNGYIKAEIDELGNVEENTNCEITSSNSIKNVNSSKIGKTIEIVNAKSNINLSVTDLSNYQPRVNYDFARNENTINYIAKMTLTKRDSNNSLELTGVTIEVRDTLPKELIYIRGSSNYGDPEEIIENDDGSTILKWFLYDAVVGEEIEDLTFSAKIKEGITDGTYVTNNIQVIPEREKIGVILGNSTKSSYRILISNKANQSFYKDTNDYVEVNGLLKYTLVYQNRTETTYPEFRLLDILPYNGDNRNSSFSGTYVLDHVDILQTKDEQTILNNNLHLFISNDVSTRENTISNETIGNSTYWTSKTIGNTINESAVAIAITGQVETNTKIVADIYIRTNGNKQGDIYSNSAEAQSSSTTDPIYTRTVDAQIIDRRIEGIIWEDFNGNGIKDDNEDYLEGVTVSLKKAVTNETTEEIVLEDVTNAYNEIIPSVETDANGSYVFEELPKDDYVVTIENMPNYTLTRANIGTNKAKNSKFLLINEHIQSPIITELNSVESPTLIKEYVNAGFIPKKGKVTVRYYNALTNEELRYTENEEEKFYTEEKEGKVDTGYEIIPRTIPGYTFSSVETGSLTGKYTLEDQTVILKYTENEYSYTVKYYIDNVEQTNDEQIKTVKYYDLVNDKIVVDKENINISNKYEGCLLEGTDPTEIPDLVDPGTTISVYYIADTTVNIKYVFGDNIRFDGNSYINTDISLFSTENKDRDFEITADIIEGKIQAVSQDTFISCSDESGSPYTGVVFRYYKAKSQDPKFELVTNANSNLRIKRQFLLNEIDDVRICRINHIMYSDFNKTGSLTTLMDYTDLAGPFNIPLTFGCSINGSGNPFRFVSSKMSNLTVTLEYSTEEITTKLPTPTRTNYIFAGWYSNASLTNKVGNGGENVALTGNMTLYARWEKELEYVVQYFIDEEIVEEDTVTDSIVVLDTAENTLPVNMELIDNDKYEGYKIDTTLTGIIPDTVTDGATINVYYTRKTDLSYIVNYREYGKNTVLANSKTVTGQTYGTTVTETAKNIPGYNATSETLDVEITTGTNEITFYYTKKTNLSYTVYYKEQGTNNNIADSKTVSGQTFGTTVTETAKNVDGYDAVSESLDIEIADGTNEITFYYTRKTGLSYTVYYKEQTTEKVLADSKTVSGQTFGDTITEIAKNVNGYDAVSETLDIEITTGLNEITFYYAKKTNLSYTVYYKEQGTNNTVADSKTVTGQTFGTTVTEIAKSVDGYDAVSESLDIEIADGTNEITFYYTKKTGLSYTVYYKEQGTDVVVANSKTVSGQTFGAIVTETAKDVNGYNAVSETLNVEITTGTNEITFYYTKAQYNYTIEYYYDNEKDTTITKTATYLDVITECEDNDRAGYVLDRKDGLPLTISYDVSRNVIRVYYNQIGKKKVRYIFGNNVSLNGDSYINTGVPIFSTDNKDRDFEITIDINSFEYNPDQNSNMNTFVACMSEVGQPYSGITLNYWGGDSSNIAQFRFGRNVDSSHRTTTKLGETQISSAKLIKENNILYYDFNNTGVLTEDADFSNIEALDYPLIFGAALDKNILPFRYVKGNITNLTLSQYYLEDENTIILPTPIRAKHTFKGWYSEATYTNKVGNGGDTVDLVDNLTLYAKWEKTLSYTVEYYKDNVLLDSETETIFVLDTAENILPVNMELIDNNKYEGYKIDTELTGEIPDTIGNGETISIYYTKRKDLSYTVYYKDQGTGRELADSKTVTEQTYGTTVTETAKTITGYNSDAETKDVEITAGTNEITFYYTKKTNLNYTVYYKKQGTETELADSKTVTGQTYGTTVTETAKTITGYSSDAETKSIEITEGTNEITFYYTKKSNLSYTVYYKEQGTEAELADSKTVSGQTYGTTVTETAKTITGYNSDAETKDVEITEGTNEITFYYTKKTNLSYTVYYKEQGTEAELVNSKTFTGKTYGERVTETAESITGYNSDAETKSIEITEGTNEITFYYTKKSNLSYTVYYKEQGTGRELADSKTVTGQTYGATVTETAKTITGYNSDAATKDVEITEGTNEITFYYTKKTNLSYTVHYKEQETNGVLADSKTVTGKTYGETVTETAESITGYNSDAETKSIEITEGTNEITFYYTKKTNLSYTVYYKEQGTGRELADSKTVTGQTYGETVTETAKSITGYNSDTETKDIEITEGTNEITFYYTKKTNLSYRVYYKEQGKETDILNSKTVTNQTYGETVTETAEVIEGFEVVGSETLSIEITEGTNEITFYYKRSMFKYTVEYYYDDEIDIDATVEGRAEYGTIISEYEDKKITGYRLKEEVIPISITADESLNVMKVYYVIDDSLTKEIKYRVVYYKDNEEVITDNIIKTITVNITHDGTIDVEKESINIVNKYRGYELDKIKVNDTVVQTIPDTVDDNDIIRIYYKRIISQIIVRFVDKNNNRIKEDYEIDGYAYETYNLDEVTDEIEGYRIRSKSKEGTIEFEEESETIIFMYDKLSKVVVQYINKENNEILDFYTIEDIVDNEYKTDTKEIEDYGLLEDELPENAEGTITEEEILVKYYYKKLMRIIVKYIEEDTNEEISKEIIVIGDIHDNYKTEVKTIDGYEISNIDTINSGEKEKTVIYYYKKKVSNSNDNPNNNTNNQNNDSNNQNSGNDEIIETIIINNYYIEEKDDTQPTVVTTITPTTSNTITPTIITNTTKNTVSNTPNTSNTVNNTKVINTSNPKTGDIIINVALGSLGLIILINIIQIVMEKSRKRKKEE